MRNAIPRQQLVSDLGLTTASPTCVEPAMLHLAYRFQFQSRITLVTCTCMTAHQFQILAALGAIKLGKLFLCYNGKRDLGRCEYICYIAGGETQ